MPSARFEVGQTVQTWDRQEQLWQEASIVEADAGDGMVKVLPTPTKRSRGKVKADAAPFYLNSRASKNIRRMPAGNERPVRKQEPPPLSSEWSFSSNYSDLLSLKRFPEERMSYWWLTQRFLSLSDCKESMPPGLSLITC